jgi:hypothetical protein
MAQRTNFMLVLHRPVESAGLCSAYTLYERGQGVTQDSYEASRWYRLAADQENSVAQCNISSLYAKGMGAPQDDAQAAQWYLLAADQGNAEAQNKLGSFY